MEPIKAKRGDLVVIKSLHNYSVLGEGTRYRIKYTVCVVLNVSRAGEVKTVHSTCAPEYPIEIKRWIGHGRTYVIPATQIDVAGALETAKNHTWPGHPDKPKYYNTLDEVKVALRPHLVRSRKVHQ